MAPTRDGFRPQGSSQVRKPTLASQLLPRPLNRHSEASDRYGFDPQYGWLRGELVYANATGQWGLRYVAREADERDPGQNFSEPYGGTLSIGNPQVLGDLQPGDFVKLSGRVDRLPTDGSSVYHVAVVQRQRI